MLIRQFRLAAGGVIWENPRRPHRARGGPEACARRELEEETGYRAGRVESLFEANLSPGSSTELMRFSLATGLEKGEQKTEEDEMISVEPLEVEKVVRMIASNEIRDAKSIAAVAYLQAMGRLRGGARGRPARPVGRGGRRTRDGGSGRGRASSAAVRIFPRRGRRDGEAGLLARRWGGTSSTSRVCPKSHSSIQFSSRSQASSTS